MGTCKVQQQFTTILLPHGDLVIGDLRIGRGMYSSGVFDNIRIYNRTLSGIEVAALYLQPDPVYSDSYYSFQDSAEQIVHY